MNDSEKIGVEKMPKARWKAWLSNLLIFIVTVTVTIFVKRYIQNNFFEKKQVIPQSAIYYAEPVIEL